MKRAGAACVEWCKYTFQRRLVMKKSMVMAVSLLFVVASAFAQQPSRSNSVSVFVTDLSLSGSDVSGSRADAAYGAAFGHMFNERFSGELSVTNQHFREFFTIFNGPSTVPTTAVVS